MKREHGYELASKSDRLFASIIQSVILTLGLILIYLLINEPISEIWKDDIELTDVLFAVIQAIIIGIVFYPLFSGNLGHKIFGLKVISSETGADFNKYDEGALREFFKTLLSYLFIPVIWILWDKKNQNLYDKITKTYVVKKWD
ncbi:RDD family protein [Christiangramia aquimixticola]|uniref:RDD family protein n=1 Tax=Christiangramia aquimixticola TaxID=1697558 RepID=UPI003AA88074